MCRIAGIIDKRITAIEQTVIAMRDSMKRGGPDSSGLYLDEKNGLGLGHRRLSLIDLSEAATQPMMSDDKKLVIVYNGEVYNFNDIKNELIAKGFHFSTSSDTEVILKSYQCWGIDGFKKLKGMFALAIYDQAKGEVLLARDASGIKPLYYYSDNNAFYFASEIKAFKQINSNWPERNDWKVYFLTYGYLPEPVTTLENVQPLEKGTCLVLNVSTLKTTRHEIVTASYSDKIRSIEEAVKIVKEKLDRAVERHLISDAPIGLFLSGGIDSSLLTLIAKKTGKEDIHTLSIVFDDAEYSEKQYQDIIAKKTGSHHRAFKLTKEMFLDAMPDIFRAMDQPTADGVNTYFISKYAKEYGLKAVLSGLGADELFGGYASFTRKSMIDKLNRVPSALLNITEAFGKDKYRKIAFLSRHDAVGEYLFHRGYFSSGETSRILGLDSKEVARTLNSIVVPDFVNGLEYGNRTSYMESNCYMQSQLLKDTDMMSMWHSIEVRVPFLDIDLIDAVNNIAPSIKFNDAQSKYLLIEAYKDILPEEIWNRKKQGFVFPFQKWMVGNENKNFRNIDKSMTERYKSNKLNWSRYWAYLIANNYTGMNRAA
ncbi:MAG: asparagine synthase (glutamine-hydrolyzing) [Bacteroidetes bacterium]|nr:asparagine synthase (glutamine-hydrolyzing) [Bacteroidota bacterium]